MKEFSFLLVFIFSFGLFGNTLADINSGLVAHYKFDGNANDSSENGNHGTEHGTSSYIEGYKSKALVIDDDLDYISVDSNLSFQNNISYSGWFNFSSGATTTWHTFFHSNSMYCQATSTGLGVMYNKDTQIIRIYNASNNCYGIRDISISLPKNTWFNFSITYDGSTVKTYKDAVLIDSFSYTGTISDTTRFIIGANHNYNTQGALTYQWYGNIDEVRIYNRALSESDIQELITNPVCTSVEAGTVNSDLDIHMPSLNYQTLFGTQNIWVDFEYYGKGSNGELLWKLKDYGANN